MLKKLDESQRESIRNYVKSGIEISVTDDDKVIVKQVRVINGYILSNKELHQRARAIFPEEKIKPVVYSLDISTITIDWIANKMKVLGLNKKDLIKQLAIKKEDLSLYFSEKKQMDNTLKAAFYYYFLYYELNKKLRNI
ncbi:MAG: hypothetical protein COA80_12940 [Leeuwenhoekiella sp.]|nr:MAG: hypothetical protein COA80_12940 [Leeuwenhoekiella sp.]|tara:strand:+ start:14881 stop:15297 length:417 start_codon:yes stop_codon:yes gene_type:complete